jgi:hypothetical protein
VAVVDHPAILDLDPSLEVVGLTEPVGIAQTLEIALLQTVRRRIIVATDAELEGDLRHALDRFRGNPGDCGD